MKHKSLSSVRSLDRHKALELYLVHMDLLSTRKSDRPYRTLEKVDTIAVKTLVNPNDTARHTYSRHTDALALERSFVALEVVFDDSSLHKDF